MCEQTAKIYSGKDVNRKKKKQNVFLFYKIRFFFVKDSVFFQKKFFFQMFDIFLYFDHWKLIFQ